MILCFYVIFSASTISHILATTDPKEDVTYIFSDLQWESLQLTEDNWINCCATVAMKKNIVKLINTDYWVIFPFLKTFALNE